MATDNNRQAGITRGAGQGSGAQEARVWPNITIPPGEFLAETLESLGLSQAELARRANRPPQAINEVVRGTKEITPDTALQFERVLGVPAHIWTRLEADYRYVKARLEDEARLKHEVVLAARYPYAAMASHGWVRRIRDRVERVRELLKFFGVASLRQVAHVEAAAFRRSHKVAASPEALAAWLRQGERKGQRMTTARFSAKRLRETFREIRAMTLQRPEDFQSRLTALLAEAGVVVVLIQELPGTGAHGATRWLRPNKALIQLSLRYRWADIFWFSLFHELGHLLLHTRHGIFIEDGVVSREEEEANEFAMDQLIPPQAYADFIERENPRSPSAVRTFAHQQGIAASIVVGRLHHDGYVTNSHLNELRARFVWKRANDIAS
jgi:HTH-type transcriptional regulator/antitoxin HigA